LKVYKTLLVFASFVALLLLCTSIAAFVKFYTSTEDVTTVYQTTQLAPTIAYFDYNRNLQPIANIEFQKKADACPTTELESLNAYSWGGNSAGCVSSNG
jgi:hypothetical protein